MKKIICILLISTNAFAGKQLFEQGNNLYANENYKEAILKTIKAGGCNCSRANFTGAYFAALKGFNSIPNSWIKKTIPAKPISIPIDLIIYI